MIPEILTLSLLGASAPKSKKKEEFTKTTRFSEWFSVFLLITPPNQTEEASFFVPIYFSNNQAEAITYMNRAADTMKRFLNYASDIITPVFNYEGEDYPYAVQDNSDSRFVLDSHYAIKSISLEPMKHMGNYTTHDDSKATYALFVTKF